jgi:peptidyl-prolyl cis-trans isomerase D
MFEFVRTHQRLMQFLLLLLIIPSFAFWGVQSYSRFREGDNAIAKVAGQSITKQDLDAAQRQQVERFRQMFGPQFDPKMMDTPEARQNILDNLIAQRALSAEAARNNLSVPPQVVQQDIMGIQAFADEQGKFDSERYKAVLAMNGKTPAAFESGVRQELAMQQLNAAIQSTAFAPNAVASRLSDLNDQEREVQQMTFKPADFTSQVKVTDEMLQTYYDQNGAQFEIPAQIKADYVVLNSDAIASQVNVSDADIKAYYDQNIKQYTEGEQRRASHILIAVKKNASDADKAAAKAKAEKILTQVRKNPADFAKLAKQYSDDPGSAQRGGDLDYFGKDMMTKPFENAVFALKQGEISDLVQSEFGYHIIEVTGIKPASVKPLDEVKNEIASDIKKQMITKKYAELADVFSNTVYEQADSLKPVADKLKLKIESVSNLTQKPNPSLSPNVPYNNVKFLQALFSDDAIKSKHNTEAIEVAPMTMIAGRVVEYKPASKRPFDEVKDIVREQVTKREAAKLAEKAGESKLTALRTKDDTSGFAATKLVSRTKAQDLDSTALMAVMKADATKLPTFVGVSLGQNGYSIFRISKVEQPATVDTARRTAEHQQITSALGQQDMYAYLGVLKQKANVKILKPVGSSTSNEENTSDNSDGK